MGFKSPAFATALGTRLHILDSAYFLGYEIPWVRWDYIFLSLRGTKCDCFTFLVSFLYDLLEDKIANAGHDYNQNKHWISFLSTIYISQWEFTSYPCPKNLTPHLFISEQTNESLMNGARILDRGR